MLTWQELNLLREGVGKNHGLHGFHGYERHFNAKSQSRSAARRNQKLNLN
jgi:hypothetical protein